MATQTQPALGGNMTGLLSVLIFPVLALTLLRHGESEPEPAVVAGEPTPEPHLM